MSAATEAAGLAGPAWPTSLGVAWSLARAEGRRLLRHPLVIVGAVMGSAIPVLATWRFQVVLNRDDSLTSEGLLPLAAAALIASHLATLRATRHGTTELHRSTPTPERAVTAGQLLASTFLALGALAVALLQLGYLFAIGGVGQPRPWVVLAGPAMVVFASCVGVAVARWAPWPVAGPLALVGIAAVFIAMANSGSLETRRILLNLSPFVPAEMWLFSVSELSFRPAATHVAYVMGLATVGAAVALLRHPGRRVAALCLCAALAATALAGAAQISPPSPADQRRVVAFVTDADRHRSCETHQGVRYCAYNEYVPWIALWRRSVEPIMSALPADAGPPLEITQRPSADDLYPSMEPYGHVDRRIVRRIRRAEAGAIHPGMRWGRNDTEGSYELGLALAVAGRVTGIESGFRLTRTDLAALPRPARKPGRLGPMGRRVDECITFEQGRAVVALWLAAQSSPGAEATFRAAVEQFPYRLPDRDQVTFYGPGQYLLDEHEYRALGYPGSGIQWGAREAQYAAQLLDRDDVDVRAAIRGSWDRLTDPAATTDEVAAALRLEPLPSLASVTRASGFKVPLDVYYAPLCR